MTAEEALAIIRERIVEACQPEEIILFGSYARGTAGPDSDLDLLVVLHDLEDPRASRVQLYNALRGIPFPKDLIVADQSEVHGGSGSEIVNTAVAEGRRVYAKGVHIA